MDVDYRPRYPGLSELSQEGVGKPGIIKTAWPLSSKADNEDSVYTACKDEFGTPRQIQWAPALLDDHYVMTTELFLVGVRVFIPLNQLPSAKKERKVEGSKKVVEDPFLPDDPSVDLSVPDNPKSPDRSIPIPVTESQQSTPVPRKPISRESVPSSAPKQITKSAPVAGHRESRKPTPVSVHKPVPRESFPSSVPIKYTPVSVPDSTPCQSAEGDLSTTVAGAPGGLDPPRDNRLLVMSILEDEGMDFENCDSAEDLCECLLHAILGTVNSYVTFSSHPLMNRFRVALHVSVRLHASRH